MKALVQVVVSSSCGELVALHLQCFSGQGDHIILAYPQFVSEYCELLVPFTSPWEVGYDGPAVF